MRRWTLQGYGVALLGVAAAVFLRMILGASFSQNYPFTLFMLAAVVTAVLGGRGPGLAAILLSVVFASWSAGVFRSGVVDPRFSTRVIVFVVLTGAITLVVDHLRRANKRLRAAAAALEDSNGQLRRSQQELKDVNLKLRQGEADLIQANERLKRSNDELETFAYAVSHDLQSPLRTIGTLCQVLADNHQGQRKQETEELLSSITSGVGRMSRLVTDLLEYSRVTNGDPVLPDAIDCNAILADVVRDHESVIVMTGAKVTSSELPLVHMNPRRLHQLLTNLIQNSLKYCSSQPPEIHVSAAHDAGRWILSVKDNGIGFDAAHSERIFLPFARLHSNGAYEGSGLGLAIVKRILDQEGGAVWAESRPGHGSTFFILLPRPSPNGQRS